MKDWSIEAFVKMLAKEVLVAKFRMMILNIGKIHKSLVKLLSLDVLIFKIVLKDWKLITVSKIEPKYEPFGEVNKIKRFLKQVKLVKNITFNGITLMKIFKVTMLTLKCVEKTEELQIKNQSFYNKPNKPTREILIGLVGLLWHSLLGETDLLE